MAMVAVGGEEQRERIVEAPFPIVILLLSGAECQHKGDGVIISVVHPTSHNVVPVLKISFPESGLVIRASALESLSVIHEALSILGRL